MTTEHINESKNNLLINKQLVNPNDPEVKQIIQKYIDQIDDQISKGIEIILLQSHNNGRNIEINKREIESLIKSHVDQAILLINVILKEQNIDINDLTVANFCSVSFKSLIEQMLKKHFPQANSNLFHGETEFSALKGIGIVVRLSLAL